MLCLQYAQHSSDRTFIYCFCLNISILGTAERTMTRSLNHVVLSLNVKICHRKFIRENEFLIVLTDFIENAMTRNIFVYLTLWFRMIDLCERMTDIFNRSRAILTADYS